MVPGMQALCCVSTLMCLTISLYGLDLSQKTLWVTVYCCCPITLCVNAAAILMDLAVSWICARERGEASAGDAAVHCCLQKSQ